MIYFLLLLLSLSLPTFETGLQYVAQANMKLATFPSQPLQC